MIYRTGKVEPYASTVTRAVETSAAPRGRHIGSGREVEFLIRKIEDLVAVFQE